MALVVNELYIAVALGIEFWVFKKSSGKMMLQHTNEKDPEDKSPSEPFVSAVNFSDTSLYIGDYGKRVQRFSLPDFKQKQVMSANKKITHVETYKNQIIVSNKAGTIDIFTFEEGKMNRLRHPCGHLLTVLDVKLIDWTPPDDATDKCALMISCGSEKKIWINRYPKTYFIESFAFGHETFVCKLAIAEPNLFISGSGDGSVRVWDLKGAEKCKVEVAKPAVFGKFAIVGLTLLPDLEDKKEEGQEPTRILFVSTHQEEVEEKGLVKILRFSLNQKTGQLTKVGDTVLKEAVEILGTVADSSAGAWVLVTKKPYLRYVNRDGIVVKDKTDLAAINEVLSKKDVDASKLPRFWHDFDRKKTKRVDITERKRQVGHKRARSKKNITKWNLKKRRRLDSRNLWEKGSRANVKDEK